MAWTVTISKRVRKQLASLPKGVNSAVFLLVQDLQESGAVQGSYPNYSKLGKYKHHCHIKKGKPCYVAIWEVIDNTIKLIEVQYVGTHEKAPY